ncbi:MAG: hypothetical protein AAF206_12035 [Bacteroidota bacterium]
MSFSKNVFSAVLFVGLFVWGGETFGCSCIGKNAVKEAFNNRDYIFIGKVVKAERMTVSTRPHVSDEVYQLEKMRYTFEITQVLKGRKRKLKRAFKQMLITGLGGGDCGIRFTKGQEYVVYADVQKNFSFQKRASAKKKAVPYLATNICTRTTPQLAKEMAEIRRHESLSRFLKKNTF